MQGRSSLLTSLVGAVTVLGPALASAAGESLSWGMLKGKIRREFPAVREITTAELAGLLADPARPRPILLDVRTEPEFQVSHLERARHFAPQADPRTLKLPLDTPIVTYCSVGYRSAAMSVKLRAAGFKDVRNLEGSIFQWANEGRPLVTTAGRGEKVHPYNRIWGLLLNRARHAEVPAAK